MFELGNCLFFSDENRELTEREELKLKRFIEILIDIKLDNFIFYGNDSFINKSVQITNKYRFKNKSLKLIKIITKNEVFDENYDNVILLPYENYSLDRDILEQINTCYHICAFTKNFDDWKRIIKYRKLIFDLNKDFPYLINKNKIV